jgi:hypothetical protein
MMHIITYKHLNEPLGLALTIKKSIDFLHKSPYYSNLRHRNQALFSQINIFFLFNKNIKEKQNLTRESQATQKSQPKDVFARRHEEHKEEKIRKCSHKKAQKTQKIVITFQLLVENSVQQPTLVRQNSSPASSLVRPSQFVCLKKKRGSIL